MTAAALRLDALGGYVELVPQEGGSRRVMARTVIDRGQARISEAALNRLLVSHALTLRLQTEQAELEVTLGGFRITATLTAVAGATGRLLLTANGLRLLGWLPVPANLVSLALARLAGRRGLYVVGPRSVELDLLELLPPLPVVLDVRLAHARVEPGWVELHCVPRTRPVS
jgi:hypothetical protein